MKAKIFLLLFLGMMHLQAQTVKKTTTTSKPVVKTTAPTTAKPVAKTTTTSKTATKKPVAKPVAKTTTSVEGIFANITTTKGTIVVQLDYKQTPVTVANFITLAEGKNPFVTNEKLKGKPFYNGLKFHRVIPDFMIQAGDPLGTGGGDPGYKFKDESTTATFDKGGILAMANAGPGTNGSQFFITHKETPWLNAKHTIFGKVTKGMDIVNLTAQDDVILEISIIRKGTQAQAFDAPKVFSAYFLNKEEDAKKQAALDVENKKKQAALETEAQNLYLAKYAGVIKPKAAYFAKEKATATTTASGLTYKITQKGSGVKPANGTTVSVNYAGYLEDGSLFDSNKEDICKDYGKFDANRAAQGGYQPFPFEMGQTGMIPGFLEGLNLVSYGDKAIIYLPSKLAYGESGAGGVIPPNATLIFEIEMLEIKADTK